MQTTKAIGDGEGDGGGSGFDEGDGGGTDYNSWTRHGEPYGRSEPSSGKFTFSTENQISRGCQDAGCLLICA